MKMAPDVKFLMAKEENGTLVYSCCTPSSDWEVITRVSETAEAEDQETAWDNTAKVLSIFEGTGTLISEHPFEALLNSFSFLSLLDGCLKMINCVLPYSP